MKTERMVRTAAVLLAVTTSLATPGEAKAASSVDGYVNFFSPDNRYGRAVNAKVELWQTSGFGVTTKPIRRDTRTTDPRGYYRTSTLPAGSYEMRCTYSYRDRLGRTYTLRGVGYAYLNGSSWPNGFVSSVSVNVR